MCVFSILGFIFQEMNWIIPINQKHGKFIVQSLQLKFILMMLSCAWYLIKCSSPSRIESYSSQSLLCIYIFKTLFLAGILIFTYVYICSWEYYSTYIKYIQEKMSMAIFFPFWRNTLHTKFWDKFGTQHTGTLVITFKNFEENFYIKIIGIFKNCDSP